MKKDKISKAFKTYNLVMNEVWKLLTIILIGVVMNETGNIVKKIDLTDGLVFKAQYEKKEELILTIQYAFIDSISGKVIKLRAKRMVNNES